MQLIEKCICLEPSALDKNIHQSLLEKARITWVGKCTKEEGYILSIEKVHKIVENHISPSTTSIIFTLLLCADVYKPVIGNVCDGHVSCIHKEHGLFVQVFNLLTVFIPTAELGKYTPHSSGEYYEDPNGHIIRMNDILTTKINTIRYEKNTFSCIGSLA